MFPHAEFAYGGLLRLNRRLGRLGVVPGFLTSEVLRLMLSFRPKLRGKDHVDHVPDNLPWESRIREVIRGEIVTGPLRRDDFRGSALALGGSGVASAPVGVDEGAAKRVPGPRRRPGMGRPDCPGREGGRGEGDLQSCTVPLQRCTIPPPSAG